MGVEPYGPIFISYRQSDGTAHALETAWSLRAAGVPVWHDQTDLPPGDTERRLSEALSSGLSGAVLLVTPEIDRSRVVREVELPQLLALEADPAFTLAVASTVTSDGDALDYTAPDRLLRQPEGTLVRLLQQPVATSAERARLAAALCRRRMEQLRPNIEANGRMLTLDIQTRVPPFAARHDAHLVLRLRPPGEGERRPNRDGLVDLRGFLGDLPQLISIAGAGAIRIRGGAHLSVACALGAALPTTLVGRIEVLDTGGEPWSLTGQAPAPPHQELIGPAEDSPTSRDRGPVLVYVDLLPQRSDAAFEILLTESGVEFAGHTHLRPLREGLLHSSEATAVVGEVSDAIRALANQHRTTEVHVLLRCPFPVAVLLGRSLNTLTVHLYEWDDGPLPDGSHGPRYVPSIVLRSGAGGSPIHTVTAPASGTSVIS